MRFTYQFPNKVDGRGGACAVVWGVGRRDTDVCKDNNVSPVPPNVIVPAGEREEGRGEEERMEGRRDGERQG